MLEYYGSQLGTVEINNTFYRMPKREVVASWAEQTPDGFSFVLKASMRITHKKRLADAGEEMEYICSTARELGDKLGPMLFQLPPWFKKDADRLKGFLAIVPDGISVAFEFRHESWFDQEIYDALKDAGAALVVSDTEKMGEPPVVATAPFGYVRLRRPAYDADALDAWAARLRDQPWESVHVFFKHEEEGAGPAMARDFSGRLAD